MTTFWMLDEQTRADLDLEAVVDELDQTFTTFGAQILERRLGQQPRSLEPSLSWVERLEAMQADTAFRTLAERLLRNLGRQRRGQVFEDLEAGLGFRPRYLQWIPYWFFLAPALTVAAVYLMGPWALLGALVPPVINLGLYLLTNPHIGAFAGSLNYLVRGLSILKRLGRLPQKDLMRLGRFGVLLQDGASSSVSADLIAMVVDYVRVFLGAELFAYSRVAVIFERYRDEIPEVMTTLGEVDVLLALSRRLDANTGWSLPQFEAGRGIRFSQLLHPLVEHPAGQNFDLTQNLVITGMNMAGKSTFLKSVALNQLLATTLGLVRASQFTTGSYLVMTSLNLADDVLTGRSRYYVEAERLLAVQKALESETLLCLIDEILTGTNTDDRILASLGLLTNFARHGGSLILAATHDTAIAQGLTGLYHGLYFDGEWDDGRLVFDYQPRSGVQTRRNALKLLEMLGLDYRVTPKATREP